MDSNKTTYATFPFEWIVKSTSCKIQYRKTFNINGIDEIFCSIINAKGNEINFSELGILLGFDLQDLAEIDIINLYLKGLTEYNLIKVNEKEQKIQLTKFGQEALQSKLKYKYYFATTEMFENQTATGETFDFSFKNVFDIENRLIHEKELKAHSLEDPELKQKLQFQLFENNIFKGEIVNLYESQQVIYYKNISLQNEITKIYDSFHHSIFKSGVNKPEVELLIGLPENIEFKSKLVRKGMFHHILTENTLIYKEDIETYKDLWSWKELAGNPKLDWNDNTIFELFLKNGDGGIWSIISEKAPIESIKSVIEKYADYWNWTTLTERFDDEFIKKQIEIFDWDFEELSYKGIELVTSLLSNFNLKEKGWDWNYLSKNLPDDFIEKHIDDYTWDFHLITEIKSNVLRNLLSKGGKNNSEFVRILLSKKWNWRFISDNIDVYYLYSQISSLAEQIDWHTVLNRFFINEEIKAKCLQDENFIFLLKQHLPENFVIAHQKYLWTLDLIDFFENQNLIQWETHKYINGFDTNENVEWSYTIFQKYYNRINTESGYINVSKLITDLSLISNFPDFSWHWVGVSQNKNLINNNNFIEKAFIGELSFSNNLLWAEILKQSSLNVSFWNKNLEAFQKATENENQKQFWSLLTVKQNFDYDFIFENKNYPWNWSYITENVSQDILLGSHDNFEIFKKWDWEIATRKIDKDTILENLEILAIFIDWQYLISNKIFSVDKELLIEGELVRIVQAVYQLEPFKRKIIWETITIQFPFELLFYYVSNTYNIDLFEWDWDYISSQKHLPTDFKTLNKFKDKINWEIFTSSRPIQKKFTYKKDEWTYPEYFKYILKYLKTYRTYWNWNNLSRLSDLNNSRDVINIFQDYWDWNYLSEFGGFLTLKKRDKDDYLLGLIAGYSLIEFTFLSKRKDIKLDSVLILTFRDKDWDWQVLSENERAEISNELILELKNKNWNWHALSKRKNIEFSNETLMQLLDKDWDWNYLSENPNFEFNAEFIERTKAKSWNWKLVSKHRTFSPSIEILTLTKDYDLDWEYISKHSSLSPTKEILAKFENKWHWKSITENPQINFGDIDFLERFADKWNWRFICESGKLLLNRHILNKFKAYLEWDLISSNTNVHFTKEIIQEFKPFWNWSNLKANKRVEELLGSYITEEINKNATLNFIDKIDQKRSEWKGSIYHFSHIDNAAEIIKKRKIQSRNKAVKNSDSAGKGVIDLRHDAHDFARFYFRPHTPTQFYNEFLGKNTTDGYNSNQYGWVSWYDKARGLGFPKCPIPIFFKFSLKEILFKNEKKCRISNGNMQTSSTKFGNIEEMINKFGFDDLYYSPQQYATKEDYNRYRNYAQQEFLVKDELAFEDLADFEIVCPSEADKILLENLLGNEHKDIFLRIVVDKRYYNNENPRVRIEEEDSELKISTNFSGEGYFVLNGASLKDIEILVGDVTKTSKDKIIFKSNISLGNVKQNIQLNFIDESNRSWFVFANSKSKNNLVNSDKWEDILRINFIFNTKHNFLELEKYFYDDYNPFSVYEKIYHHKYDKGLKISIDYSKLEYILCTDVHNDDLSALKGCNNLKAVWAYGSKDWEKFKKEMQLLEKNNLCVVFKDNDEDIITIDQDEYFPLFFVLRESKSNDDIINLFKKFEVFKNAFETTIRHYRLDFHTQLVLNQFSNFFGQNNTLVNNIQFRYFGAKEFSNTWFKVFLALHDIGKAKAFKQGNKSLQYKFSKEIILMIANNLPFNNGVISIYLSLLENDCLGEYFQGKLDVRNTKLQLLELASNCGLSVKDFVGLYIIYYQCDIASYTADAGGIKFLEHLFEYENGEKVFDEEEGLLKMSPRYWEMYKQLKNEIVNGN